MLRLLVYRTKDPIISFACSLDILLNQTPRYAKMAIVLRDHDIGFNASFFLLTDNTKHLCIWYSDALEVSVFACYGLVFSKGLEVNGLTQDQYHIFQELVPWPSTEQVAFIAPMAIHRCLR